MFALSRFRFPHRLLVGLAIGVFAAQWAQADDLANVRKALQRNIPDLKVDALQKAPIAGLFEVQSDGDIYYVDEQANYLIQGQIVDTRTKQNITQAKLDKLNAIDFASLPLKDAIVWKSGTGKRKMAIFADPNCGYCKRFEHTLQGVKDVTVYTFMIPILGGDSPQKAHDIWCSKDRTNTWRNWMLAGAPIQRSMGPCDTSALDRNLAMAHRYHVDGTPNLVFESGFRAPGALPEEEVEKRLNEPAGSVNKG
jgi:thiol:disulfide interchange protein DsbC